MDSYYDDDYMYYKDEADREEFIEQELKGISQQNAETYLGTYGDAVDIRVQKCLKEAEELLASNYAGSALCLAATAIELMIRYLLLRPLIQGAFLSDEWAALLARRVVSGRSANDRDLLPAVLRQWGMDITTFRTDSGVAIWEYVLNRLWPARNMFTHRADHPECEVVASAIECARHFRKDIVGSLASKFGFTLETTGKWCEIKEEGPFGSKHYSAFSPQDPFTGPGEGV